MTGFIYTTLANLCLYVNLNETVFFSGLLDQDTTTLLTVQDSNKYSNISSTPTIIIAPSPISVQPTSTSRSLLTNSPKKATSTG